MTDMSLKPAGVDYFSAGGRGLRVFGPKIVKFKQVLSVDGETHFINLFFARLETCV